MSHDRERARPEDRALRAIFEGTAAETGERFFDELVRHVAEALDTRYAWVTEWAEPRRRLQAISFWKGDGYFEEYAYDIAGTPCESVMRSRDLACVPDRVIDLFPDDPDLAPMEAVSYMGVPLVDPDGSVLGNLAVMDTEPLEETPEARAIFRIFAARAAAELSRIHRDRDLREREEKLSRLVDGAMDAIVEVDPELVVTQANRAAEGLFGAAGNGLAGEALGDRLSRSARRKLAYLIRELDREPRGKPSLWIHDGLEARTAAGAELQLEATISRHEKQGTPLYTLILRDLADRLEAEERIRSLTDETEYLRAELDSLRGFDEILGDSAALRALLADVEKVAGTDATVLITGETGTGKELVARAIHRRSGRSDEPLIKVNCAAIPANLQESELFGHEKGAFTGATQRRQGRFKLADRGTLFLDEVGELPPELQAKLLRVLQEGEYEPVGSSRTEKVDVRVISATNRDPEAMVKEGSFRKDLLYRLNVFPLHAPSLRERGGDVVLLAEAFARRIARRYGRPTPRLTADCKAKLRRYDWPGNVRELQNVVERAVITSVDGVRLNLDRALPDAPPGAEAARPPAAQMAPAERVLTETELRDLERDNMVRALEASGWKVSGPDGAAERLGLKPNTLASRMKSMGIERPPDR